MPSKTINGIALKPTMRRIAEMGIVAVLGKVPRSMRREAARRYANAAWRDLRGLPSIDPKANPEIVKWVSNEFRKIAESQPNGKVLARAGRIADDVGSPAAGPAERSPEVSFEPVTED